MSEPRINRFVVVCNSQERRMIAELANRLKRSQGDAVRTVIREAVSVLREQEIKSAERSPEAETA